MKELFNSLFCYKVLRVLFYDIKDILQKYFALISNVKVKPMLD